jgi:FkbM family methyltransferase
MAGTGTDSGPATPRTRGEKRALHNAARRFVYDNVAEAAGERPVFAVQVGANDGKLSDPLLPYFETAGWHGLLLEPNPVYFDRLSDRHADRPHVAVRRIGCSSSEGALTLHYLNPDFEHLYRRDAQGCASMDKERMRAALAKENPDVPDDHLAEITVPVRPLAAILADEGVGQVDVLVIDVEGHEPEVLAGTDLRAMAPTLAVVEQNTRATREAIFQPFRNAGFEMFKLAGDVYALGDDYPAREAAAEILLKAGGWRVES